MQDSLGSATITDESFLEPERHLFGCAVLPSLDHAHHAVKFNRQLHRSEFGTDDGHLLGQVLLAVPAEDGSGGLQDAHFCIAELGIESAPRLERFVVGVRPTACEMTKSLHDWPQALPNVEFAERVLDHLDLLRAPSRGYARKPLKAQHGMTPYRHRDDRSGDNQQESEPDGEVRRQAC